MADYSSDIVVIRSKVNFNHIGIRCLETHNNEC